MDFLSIKKLAWYKPQENVSEEDRARLSVKLPETVEREVVHLMKCYSDLQFGWNLALALQDRIEFPSFLEGKDIFVWRAYLYLQGIQDDIVQQALGIASEPDGLIKTKINTLLLSKETDIPFIAQRLGLPVDVVTAYEVLFFNILDRRKEHVFISNIVYPQGRLEESTPDYLKNVTLQQLMYRAGYNAKNIQESLYHIGVDDNPFKDFSKTSGAEALESTLMSNAVLLMNTGLLHHKSAAISRALGLMNARAMGGEGASAQDDALMDTIDLREDLIQLNTGLAFGN